MPPRNRNIESKLPRPNFAVNGNFAIGSAAYSRYGGKVAEHKAETPREQRVAENRHEMPQERKIIEKKVLNENAGTQNFAPKGSDKLSDDDIVDKSGAGEISLMDAMKIGASDFRGKKIKNSAPSFDETVDEEEDDDLEMDDSQDKINVLDAEKKMQKGRVIKF